MRDTNGREWERVPPVSRQGRRLYLNSAEESENDRLIFPLFRLCLKNDD